MPAIEMMNLQPETHLVSPVSIVSVEPLAVPQPVCSAIPASEAKAKISDYQSPAAIVITASIELMSPASKPSSSQVLMIRALQIPIESLSTAASSSATLRTSEITEANYLNPDFRRAAIDAIHNLVIQLARFVKAHTGINQWRRFVAENAELAYNIKFVSPAFNSLRKQIKNYPAAAQALHTQIDLLIATHNENITQFKTQFDNLTVAEKRNQEEIQKELNHQQEIREQKRMGML